MTPPDVPGNTTACQSASRFSHRTCPAGSRPCCRAGRRSDSWRPRDRPVCGAWPDFSVQSRFADHTCHPVHQCSMGGIAQPHHSYRRQVPLKPLRQHPRTPTSGALARRADRSRNSARIHHEPLVRRLWAGRHAAAAGGAPQRRDQQGAGRARSAIPPGRHRCGRGVLDDTGDSMKPAAFPTAAYGSLCDALGTAATCDDALKVIHVARLTLVGHKLQTENIDATPSPSIRPASCGCSCSCSACGLPTRTPIRWVSANARRARRFSWKIYTCLSIGCIAL